MSKIAIIGTGKLGTRLSEQVIIDGFCDKVFLWNRSQQKLRGTVLSLSLWASLRKSKTAVSCLDWSDLRKVEAVVISVKENYDPRYVLRTERLPRWLPHEFRYAGLLYDLPQVKKICARLDDYHGLVIVVTNPVDVFTTLVSQWLPKAKVVGLGSTVDSARLCYVIGREYGIDVSPYNLLVGGEHGRRIVPFRSLWSSEIKRRTSLMSNLKSIIRKADRVREGIMGGLGYTLQDCALIFCRDVAWLLGRGARHRLSSYSISDGTAAIGSPVLLAGALCPRLSLDSLDEKERQQLQLERQAVAQFVEKLANASSA